MMNNDENRNLFFLSVVHRFRHRPGPGSGSVRSMPFASGGHWDPDDRDDRDDRDRDEFGSQKTQKVYKRCPTLVGFSWICQFSKKKNANAFSKSMQCCTGLERPFKKHILLARVFKTRFRPPGSQRPSIASVASLACFKAFHAVSFEIAMSFFTALVYVLLKSTVRLITRSMTWN